LVGMHCRLAPIEKSIFNSRRRRSFHFELCPQRERWDNAGFPEAASVSASSRQAFVALLPA
jgi:hypothetical protein